MLINILREYGDMKILKNLFVLGVELDFVVTFSNCPLLWESKIQTYIALSTLHSEYVALSHSIRAIITLQTII